MGNDLGVNKSQMKEWQDRYSIPPEKLNELLRAFKKQSGKDNTITRDQFLSLMQQYGVADMEFAEAIFDSFDQDGSGTIDVKEYMSLMGVTFGGSIRDKLEASFTMFDTNGDGELDRDEVRNMVLMVSRAVIRRQFNTGKDQAAQKRATGKTEVEIPEELKQKINEMIDEVFKQVDTDGNGTLSREEFIQGFSEHREICSFFKQF